MKKARKIILGAAVLLAICLIAGAGVQENIAEPNAMAAEKTKNYDLAKEKDEDVKQMEEFIEETNKATENEKEAKKTPQNTTVKEEVLETSSKTNNKAQSTKPDKKDSEEETKPNEEVEEIKPDKEEEKVKPDRDEAEVHTHEWEPVYATREVEKTRQVAWTKCYACGADMTGNISHIDQHLLNHETNVHYGTEYRTEIYYENETYISGYKCSCGQTK